MDVFKQRRYLWFTIIILVLMNISALTVLWIGRPVGPKPLHGPPNSIEDKNRLPELLMKELGFDETQAEQYLILRQKHREQTHRLESEIRRLKKDMFDEVLKDNPQQMLSDSLLELIQKKQAALEKNTYRHFLDLRELCKSDQRKSLKILIHEIFRKNAPPPPEGMQPPRHDGMRPPPPPQNGETQPPRPPENL